MLVICIINITMIGAFNALTKCSLFRQLLWGALIFFFSKISLGFWNFLK